MFSCIVPKLGLCRNISPSRGVHTQGPWGWGCGPVGWMSGVACLSLPFPSETTEERRGSRRGGEQDCPFPLSLNPWHGRPCHQQTDSAFLTSPKWLWPATSSPLSLTPFGVFCSSPQNELLQVTQGNKFWPSTNQNQLRSDISFEA